jgi:hypothetical protein
MARGSMLCSAAMWSGALALALLLMLPLPLRAESVTISAERWATPRSGETVAAWSELRELMAAFDRKPGSQLVIRYAPGENGSLWAEELRSWLVSLGIPSSRVSLKHDLQRRDIVRVDTMP